MSLLATLVGNPASAALTHDHVAAARAALARSGADVHAPDWLAPAIACDLAFAGVATTDARALLAEALRGAPVDIIVQPRTQRRKRLLLADMDSTIIPFETLDALAAHAGAEAQIAPITARAMNGEIDFAQALRARVTVLAGLSATALEAVAATIDLNPGARTLVRTMRAHGAYTALVSGGFTVFAERVRTLAGFDHAEANAPILAEGRFTGDVREPIINRDSKRTALARIARGRGIDPALTIAVGDGANDIDMLESAGLGIAYRAKPAVVAIADAAIAHGDLTALLYAQGYRSHELTDDG